MPPQMGPSSMSAAPMAGSPMGHHAPAPASYSPAPTLSYDAVAAMAPEHNTTVYVGNLIPFVTQADLIPLFQGYGYIVEIRMQSDRGFAFVKLDTHHNAAMAITHLQNQMVHGRGIKCSWGKDKLPDGPTGGSVSPAPAVPQYQAPMVSTGQTHDVRVLADCTAADGLPSAIRLLRRIRLRPTRRSSPSRSASCSRRGSSDDRQLRLGPSSRSRLLSDSGLGRILLWVDSSRYHESSC